MRNCNEKKYIFLIILVILFTLYVFLNYILTTHVNPTLTKLNDTNTNLTAIEGYPLTNYVNLTISGGTKTNDTNTNSTAIEGNESIENKVGCNIPKLNPFNPKVLRLLREPKDPRRCDLDPKFPLLFETDFDNNLIRLKNLEDFGFRNCCYKYFRRLKGNDLLGIWLSPECTPIQKKVTKILTIYEFIAVYCEPKQNATSSSNRAKKRRSKRKRKRKLPEVTLSPIKVPEQMVDIFNFVNLKPEVEERILNSIRSGSPSHNPDSPKLSVVILGVDAVSHMHFKRAMPKTFRYLTEVLSAVGMNGYVKVGENTSPNIIPVLTGLTVSEFKRTCWPKRRMYLDKCPFIWKNFSAQGYRTSFGEDDADYAIHSLLTRKGFDNPPTDYYIRPMNLLASLHIAHDTRKCVGPRFEMQVMLNNIEKMAWTMGGVKSDRKDSSGDDNKHNRSKIEKRVRENREILAERGGAKIDNTEKGNITQEMSGAKNSRITHEINIPRIKPYFQWIWSNTLSHDGPDFVYHADALVLPTLQFLNSEGFLNHTVFILMSDHGHRTGGLQRTHQGRIEARMPFMYFAFPKWFVTKYAEALKNMKKNVNRLTTAFDLHETLKDFLDMRKSISNERILVRESEMKSGNLSRGISLFLPIPLSRKCTEAGIIEHWCVCKTATEISTNHSQVIAAADNFVLYMNHQLKKYRECSVLKLKNIISAQTDRMNEADYVSTKLTITFILETTPGDGLFETSMMQTVKGQWIHSEDNRINLYGNQSHCVKDNDLRRYCYCKDLVNGAEIEKTISPKRN